MRFRDYSAEFAPSPDIFRLAGRGLGSDVRGAVRKAARRPLFKKLADRFRTGNEAKAELNTLAQMGLQAPPMQGDTQYPIFQDIKAHHLSMLNQRPDRAQEMFPLDEQGAMDYLTGEDKIYAAKGGEGSSKEREAFSPQVNAAIDKLITTANESYRLGGIMSQDQSKSNQDAYNQAYQNLVTAKGEFYKVTGGKKPSDLLDSQSQVMTTLKAANEMHNTLTNIKGKKSGLVNDVLTRIQKTIKGIADKPKVQNWTNSAQLLSTSADQIQMYIDNFDKWKTQPNVLFGAVKELGKAIEPGLQVTEGEVAGFLGQNRVSSFIGGLQELGESFKAAFGFDAKDKQAGEKLLRKMQQAAATDQPQVLKDILIQASNVIANAQNSYGKFISEAKQNAENIGGSEITARTMHMNDAEKQVIKDNVAQYIDSQFSGLAMFSQMQRQTPGGELVSSPQDEEWDMDFSAYGAGEYEAESKKRIESAEASSTLNPIKKEVSKGAAAVATKAEDDILNQLFGEQP